MFVTQVGIIRSRFCLLLVIAHICQIFLLPVFETILSRFLRIIHTLRSIQVYFLWRLKI